MRIYSQQQSIFAFVDIVKLFWTILKITGFHLHLMGVLPSHFERSFILFFSQVTWINGTDHHSMAWVCVSENRKWPFNQIRKHRYFLRMNHNLFFLMSSDKVTEDSGLSSLLSGQLGIFDYYFQETFSASWPPKEPQLYPGNPILLLKHKVPWKLDHQGRKWHECTLSSM